MVPKEGFRGQANAGISGQWFSHESQGESTEVLIAKCGRKAKLRLDVTVQ